MNNQILHDTILVRVEKKDIERMMNQCKELYLKWHPEMKDIKLSRRFMFKQLVEFYLNAKVISL